MLRERYLHKAFITVLAPRTRVEISTPTVATTYVRGGVYTAHVRRLMRARPYTINGEPSFNVSRLICTTTRRGRMYACAGVGGARRKLLYVLTTTRSSMRLYESVRKLRTQRIVQCMLDAHVILSTCVELGRQFILRAIQ